MSKLVSAAVAVSIFCALVFNVGTTQTADAAVPYSSTVSFLAKSFVNGQALESAEVGIPDFTKTLEAMLQLKAGGRNLVQQLPAIRYMLSTRTAPFGVLSKGYLFNKDELKTINLEAVGKFLFISQALNVPNTALRFEIYKRLAARIDAKTGVIAESTNGATDYAWVALGLNAFEEYTLANKVVQVMLTLQNSDGGFAGPPHSGDDTDVPLSNFATTGLALQAINYKQTFGSANEDSLRAKAEKLAVSYLFATDTADSYWTVNDVASVSATSYALMGLKSYGAKPKTVLRYTTWLKTQLSAKGGFKATSESLQGDRFLTAQGYTALIGKSYLDLLPK